MKKKCKICRKTFIGRSDKKFCSLECKNIYHTQLRRATKSATQATDNILHRNRSILLEILGKNQNYKKVKRIVLDHKNYKYDYITGYHINNNGKTVHHVYDFSWLIFSDEEVLIKRKK